MVDAGVWVGNIGVSVSSRGLVDVGTGSKIDEVGVVDALGV